MRRRIAFGRSNAVMQTAAICLFIAAAVGLMMLIPNSSLFTMQPPRISHIGPDPDPSLGEIRLERTWDGKCRVFAFDNRSGQFQEKGLTPCDADSLARDQGGRLDSISKSFKGR
jgi:hypothetical protein